MSFLFNKVGSSANNPAVADTRLKIQSSIVGSPRQIGCGQTRIAPTVFGYYDFKATPVDNGGGKGGGGKGGVVSSGKGGGGATSFSYSATLMFGVGEGPVSSFVGYWNNQDQLKPLTAGNIFLGTYTQNPWSVIVSRHPSQALAYRGLAYQAIADFGLGQSTALPNFTYEILWRADLTNAISGLPDCNPRDWVKALLSDPDWGAGFPSASVATMDVFANYCLATGLVISDTLTASQALNNYLTQLVAALNCELVWNGTLDIRSYGDVALSANGGTYTPAGSVATFNDGDYLSNQNGDQQTPIQCVRSSWAEDAPNSVRVECLPRTNQYNPSIVEAKDEALISQFHYRPGQVVTNHFFKSQSSALLSAHLQLARLYVRNTYSWTADQRWIALDPMDKVTLNSATQNISGLVVRIREISENDDGSLTFTAEEVLPGQAFPYASETPLPNGLPAPCPPGPTIVAIWDATLCRAMNATSPALVIAAAGAGTSEGGAYITGPTAGPIPWTVPAGVFLLDTVDIWAPGGLPGGLSSATGGGAFSRRNNVAVTPGQVIMINIPAAASGAAVVVNDANYAWFDSITTQRAQRARETDRGTAAQSIGDLVNDGGVPGSGRGAGGAGAGGPHGAGQDGGAEFDRFHGSAGGGGADGGTPGAAVVTTSGSSGGSNFAGQPGALGPAAGSGPNALNPGTGGAGAANNNDGAVNSGGNGGDDIDNGGGGGGGATDDFTCPMSGFAGNGGFPGGGTGGTGFTGSPHPGTPGAGQIKITWGGLCNFWGSAQVWVSLDGGTTYNQNPQDIPGPSPIGVLTASFASGSDPDTTDTLSIDISESFGSLSPFSQQAADAGLSAAMIETGGVVEIIDFTDVTLTGPGQYDLDTYIRRGQLGTAIAAHSAGNQFALLGPNSIVIPYDPALIGQTIFLKFAARSADGSNLQDLSAVPAHGVLLVGPAAPVAPVIVTAIEPVASSGAVVVNWTPATGCAITGYDVAYQLGAGADVAYLTNSNTLATTIAGLTAGSYTFKVWTVNAAGIRSAAPATVVLVVT